MIPAVAISCGAAERGMETSTIILQDSRLLQFPEPVPVSDPGFSINNETGPEGGTEWRTTMLQMYTPPPGVGRANLRDSKC
jgi:hypothetical protein